MYAFINLPYLSCSNLSTNNFSCICPSHCCNEELHQYGPATPRCPLSELVLSRCVLICSGCSIEYCSISEVASLGHVSCSYNSCTHFFTHRAPRGLPRDGPPTRKSKVCGSKFEPRRRPNFFCRVCPRAAGECRMDLPGAPFCWVWPYPLPTKIPHIVYSYSSRSSARAARWGSYDPTMRFQ